MSQATGKRYFAVHLSVPLSEGQGVDRDLLGDVATVCGQRVYLWLGNWNVEALLVSD